MDALSSLARKSGAAVIVVTHTRKSTEEEGRAGMDAIAGSAQLVAAARVAIMLERMGRTEDRRFRVVKSNLGQYDEDGWLWTFAWPDPFNGQEVHEMPHIVWRQEDDERKDEGDKTPIDTTETVRPVLMPLLAQGPVSIKGACDIVLDRTKAGKRYVMSRASADLAIRTIATEGDGIEIYDGPRGQTMICLRGQRPETPEAKAMRLAKENPTWSVRQIKDAAQCRAEVACEARNVEQ
jgi:hypothetical protein